MNRISTNEIRHKPRTSSIYLALSFVTLIFLSIFSHPINIIIDPMAVDRESLGNFAFWYGIRPILLLFMIYYFVDSFKNGYAFSSELAAIYVISILMPFAVLISVFYNDLGFLSWPWIYSRFILLLLGFYIIRCSAFHYLDQHLALCLLFIACTTFIYFFCNLLYSNDLITITYIGNTGIGRPQFRDFILVSTEFSNMLSTILILGFVLLANKENSLRTYILIAGCILLSVLIAMMFSVGTFVSLLVIYLLSRLEAADRFFDKIFKIGFLIICAVVLIYCVGQFIDLSQLYDTKSDDTVRQYTYGHLYASIVSNPITGYGLDKTIDLIGYAAHHNLLGAWAECGLLAMFVYLFYFVLPFFTYYKYRLFIASTNQTLGDDLYLFKFCMYTLMFLHLKGLVHDTWTSYEIYLFSGVLLAYLQIFKHPNQSISNYNHGLFIANEG